MIIDKNGLKYFAFENLMTAGVRHCFSTRVGGVSEGVYASLNLGFNSGDDAEAVRENFRRLCDAVGFDVNNIVMTKQVHGVNIRAVESERKVAPEAAGWGLFPSSPVEVDGLMTNKPDITLATYYADCVPLLFFDPVRRVIANAHAGWRGCAQNMAGTAINAMTTRYNCDPVDILAGIGPSISAENFEVDEDVVASFKKTLPFSDVFIYNSKMEKNKFHVDLWGICRESLILAGLKSENVEIAGLCTHALPELFYSHRRDGLPRGNMVAMIAL